MTIFDLLALAAVLATLVTLLTTAVFALRGRHAQALRILRNLGMCAAAYIVSGLAVSLFSPQRVMRVGDPWCFDDWCLSVEQVDPTPGPAQSSASVSYNVNLRIFSTAGRVSQRALGAWIYLI